MSDDPLSWLSRWFLSQCNSEWEHADGIQIESLDNPGWMLKIYLRGTDLEGRLFETLVHGEPNDDLDEWQRNGSWWVVRKVDYYFEAACGPLDLPKVVEIFRAWAEAPQ